MRRALGNSLAGGRGARGRGPMFVPWHTITMLALEAQSVVSLRLAKIGCGGPEAIEEMRLMFSEKTSAAMEAGAAMALGSTPLGIVDRYRDHVAANHARLTSSNLKSAVCDEDLSLPHPPDCLR